MFAFTNVLDQLHASDWPQPIKDEAEKVIPQLGKWALSFVSQQINHTGGIFNAQDIWNVISLEPTWNTAIQEFNDEAINTSINNIFKLQKEHCDRALLAIILDIRNNQTLNNLLTDSVSELFDNLEVRYFHKLPVIEVTSLLNQRIHHLFEFGDLQMEVKRYCYYRGDLQVDSQEIQSFKRALENNNQSIGVKNFTVKEWINDFLQTAAASSNRSVFNVAAYLTNSQKAKKLNNDEKDSLGEILKLYNWLFQPFVTIEEIEGYEAHRLEAHHAFRSDTSLKNSSSLPIAPPPMEVVDIPAPKKLPAFDAARATPSPTLHTNKYSPQSLTMPPAAPITTEQTQPPKPKPAMKVPGQFAANPGDIFDVINQKPKIQKMGVVMDPTNVKLEEEKQRIVEDRQDQAEKIQDKLAELRKRNKI